MTDAEMKVAVPLLTSSNYATWKPRITAFITVRDLKHILSGTTTTPAPAEQQTAADAQHAKEQDKVHALITMHLSDQFMYLAEAHKSGSELWTALDTYFASKLTSRVFDLKGHLLHLTKLGSEDISTFVGRLQTLHNELVSAGGNMKDELSTILLRGLPDDYTTLRTALMIGKIGDLDEIVPHLLRQEQLLKEKETPEHTAFFSAKYRGKPMGFGGRASSNSKPGGGGGGARQQFNGNCHYCGGYGHRAADCRKQQRDLAQHNQQPRQCTSKPIMGGLAL